MATQQDNTTKAAETFQERLVKMNKSLMCDLFKIQTGVSPTDVIDTAANIATLRDMEKVLTSEKALYDQLYHQRMEWITNGGLLMCRYRVNQLKNAYPQHEIVVVTKDQPATVKQGKVVWMNEMGSIIRVQD